MPLIKLSADPSTWVEVSDAEYAWLRNQGALFIENTDMVVDAAAYRMVGCVIRNTGSGFQVLNDAGHKPVGVAGVREVGGDIVIDYEFTATKVISLVAGPDETYASRGYQVGASVGLSAATLRVGQNVLWSDYISWGLLADGVTNGLKSFNNLAYYIGPSPTPSLAAQGWLRYDFNSPVAFSPVGGTLTTRNPLMPVVFEGAGASSSSPGALYGGFNFRFVDLAGAPIIAPDLTQIKLWATMNSTFTRKPPLSELVIPSSNFWVSGIFEVGRS